MNVNKKQIAAIATALVGYATYMKVFKGADIDVSAFINVVNILLGGN